MIGLITLLLHDGDHVRQGVTAHYHPAVHVVLVNAIAFVPFLLALHWAARGRVRAAATATALASATVLGALAFVHLVGVTNISPALGPVFGMWAHTYRHMGVDAVSWAALVMLLAGQGWVLTHSLRLRASAVR